MFRTRPRFAISPRRIFPRARARARLLCSAALLALAAAFPAWGGEPAPRCAPSPAGLPADGPALARALTALDALAPACRNDAAWHARRGALLLVMGRLAEAAESLEHAILLAPAHAGAHIDYADVLAGLGDVAAARALAEALLARPDVPPAARAHLEARLRQWRTPASPWLTRVSLGAQRGWESNLNGGPAADTVLLTPVDGPVHLRLDDAQQSRGGAATLYDAELHALRALDDRWTLLAHGGLRLRDAAGGRDDYLLGQFDASLLRRHTQGQFALQLGQTHQTLAGDSLLAETRLGARHVWNGQHCRPRLGLDVLQRRYPGARILDGRQLGVCAGLQCGQAPWRVDAELILRADRPRHASRPGGAQRWTELRLGATWLGAQYTVTADAGFARIIDAESYSPLLAWGARRDFRRGALRLEVTRALSPRWEAVATLESFRQSANIGLFDLHNHGFYAGARYRY